MTRLYKCFEDYDLTLEESEERKRVRNFLDDKVGKGYFDKYLKIRNRLTDKNLKDFNTLITLDPEDVKIAIDRYFPDDEEHDNSEGKRKIGENEDWVVWRVTSFPASKELGEGTSWCISGNYGNMNHDDSHYFYDYIKKENLDGGYYFYIPKDSSKKKYCILIEKSGHINSVWKSPNSEVYDVSNLNFPEIRGIDLSSYGSKLGKQIEKAYEEDDSDTWGRLYYQMSDKEGREPAIPTWQTTISDDKPNMFQYILEESYSDFSADEIKDMIVYTFRNLDDSSIPDFLEVIRGLYNFDNVNMSDVFEDVVHSIKDEDKLETLLSYFYDSIDLTSVINLIGIDKLNKWSERQWYRGSEVTSALIDNCGGLDEFLNNKDEFDKDEWEKIKKFLEEEGYKIEDNDE